MLRKFNNCIFYYTNLGSSISDGDREFKNCKFIGTAASNFAIQAAKNLTVENCEFTNCARGINLINTACDERPANRVIVIKNNVFNGITDEKAIIQIAYGKCSSKHSTHANQTEAEKIQSETQLTIEGNTFNGLGEGLGIVRVHDSIGTLQELTQEVVTEFVKNVTFKNNKVNSSISRNQYVIDDDGKFTEQGKNLVSQLLEKFN